MIEDKLRVVWEVEDGYAGKSRPQEFEISKTDIEWCDSLEEVEAVALDMTREDFEHKISWALSNHEAIMEWATAVLAERERGR